MLELDFTVALSVLSTFHHASAQNNKIDDLFTRLFYIQWKSWKYKQYLAKS